MRAVSAFVAVTAMLAATAAAAQPVGAPPATPPATATTPPDPVALALAPQPGGLTPDEVAKRAGIESPSVRARIADVEAASARVDQAAVNFFPKLTLTATYTRLSSTENVIAIGACPDNPTETCQLPPSKLIGPPLFSFRVPVYLNNYAFVASLVVPLSDYALRVSQGYAAESHNEAAKKLDARAERVLAEANARIAYYNWITARGQAVVAKDDIAQAQAHLDDAKKRLDLGFGSQSDVMLMEARVASAQQAEIDALAVVDAAETELRMDIGAAPGERLAIGTDVFATPPQDTSPSLERMYAEALGRRLEIRALDETRYSLRETVAGLRAGYAPRLDAFADGYLMNPNPRQVPQQGNFFFTWDAGARLTWTINDTFSSLGAVAEAKAKVRSLEAQKSVLKNAILLEVERATTDVRRTRAAIEAADRGLAAAEEALRVRREQFRLGKATASDLIDSETELTKARLNRLSARVGLLAAKSRLDHATGRDAGPLGP